MVNLDYLMKIIFTRCARYAELRTKRSQPVVFTGPIKITLNTTNNIIDKTIYFYYGVRNNWSSGWIAYFPNNPSQELTSRDFSYNELLTIAKILRYRIRNFRRRLHPQYNTILYDKIMDELYDLHTKYSIYSISIDNQIIAFRNNHFDNWHYIDNNGIDWCIGTLWILYSITLTEDLLNVLKTRNCNRLSYYRYNPSNGRVL